ncbi:MAG: MerR family transcriptional regulator [Clostridia bacterium]|nr:MerR family transcriptional regulator [Clostridia bacterium]
MKIKTVCELTGLTDRTVRYYIEEGLISPLYTENYLGRKQFAFSEREVAILRDIAVLRKFGFSIAEIKQIHEDPEKSTEIIETMKQTKEKNIKEETALLSALLRLESARAYTISELATALSAPVVEVAVPRERIRPRALAMTIRGFRMLMIGISLVLPILFLLQSAIAHFRWYAYPTFRFPNFIYLLLTLVPTFCVLGMAIPRKKRLPTLWKKTILFIFCVIYIPLSFLFSFGLMGYSETTDFRDYRKLDPGCLANRSGLYQELFPVWPHYFENVMNEDGQMETVYLDAQYYYRYYEGFDYTYDIYTEWPLEQDAFDKEVARVKALLETRDCQTIQKEQYTCLIIDAGWNGDPLFSSVTESYTYYIFAYDEERLRVRYLLCDSLENGADQPYYLELDW